MRFLSASPRLKRWVYFLIGGGLNTALTYGLYMLLKLWLTYQIAYGASYAIGIFLAYVFNSKMVFQTQQSLKGLLLYPAIYGVQYILGAAIIGTLVERFGIPTSVAPLAAIVLLIPVGFVLNKWILKKFSPPTKTITLSAPNDDK